MICRMSNLEGYAVRATDGFVGYLRDVSCSGNDWAARYAVVETGQWLAGRKVMISTSAFESLDVHRNELEVRISKEVVRCSSAQMTDNAQLHTYGSMLDWDVQALDAPVGRVDGLLLDEDTWTALYLVVRTGEPLLGQQVTIAMPWIHRVDWSGKSITVGVSGRAARRGSARLDIRWPKCPESQGMLHCAQLGSVRRDSGPCA